MALCLWTAGPRMEERLSRISSNCMYNRSISSVQLSGIQSLPVRQSRILLSGKQEQKWTAFAVRADSNWEKEEARWLREEERWLREEQRWLREEARWKLEKSELTEEMALLRNQVAVLNSQVDELRSQFRADEVTDASLRNLVSGMKTLLQALAVPSSEGRLNPPQIEKLQIPEISLPHELNDTTAEAKSIEGELFGVTMAPEVIRGDDDTVSSARGDGFSSRPPQSTTSARDTPSGPGSKKSRTLRTGMDGDDVKELQEALLKRGFYSGEEEIEFSMFSDGTENAVKSWQASIGEPEDGQMTAKLVLRLLTGAADIYETEKTAISGEASGFENSDQSSSNVASSGDNELGAKTVREIDRYGRTDAEDYSGSQRRVYLLGENRWEEPGRLTQKGGKKQLVSVNGLKQADEKCFSCSGVGTMLCTECEGTGDLNVEEQFLEWVGEEAKCPYCTGAGAIACDVCDGQGVKKVNK